VPADILLFAIIAAGLIFWLRSLLGTESEEDKNAKPRSLFSEEEKERLEKIIRDHDGKNDEKQMGLTPVVGFPVALPKFASIENKTTENRLEDILKKNESLDLVHFVQGARGAFEIIVEAFADGDKETLEDLLAPGVYESFATAIDERAKTGEVFETTIHGVRQVEIIEANKDSDMLYLAVRFTADETCLIYDKDGELVSGNPDRITEMRDVWVFGRNMTSDEQAWLVYETREGGEEAGQSPMPDAS